MRFVMSAIRPLALLLLVLVAVEVATRFDDWARFDMPFTSSRQSIAELIITDSVGTHARANSQFRQFRINALGFRGEEIPSTLLHRGRLIVVSGASESFGLYESRGKEWPRQLEDSLRASCGPDIAVANAAFAGMTLPTVEQDIRLRLALLYPALIVYYPTPMQYLEKELPVATPPSASAAADAKGVRARAIPRFRDAIKRLTPVTVLDLLRQRDINASRAALNTRGLDHVPTARLDAYERSLRRLVGAIRAVGARPGLAIHQNRFSHHQSGAQDVWLRAWERYHPMYTGEAILEFDRMSAERTRVVARDSSVILVDASAAVRDVVPPPFADYAHFDDRGAAIMAGTTARAVVGSVCAPR